MKCEPIRAGRLLLAVLLLLASLAPAAENDTPQPPAGGRGVMLQRLREAIKELDVSPEQQKKIDAILSDAGQQLGKLREDADGNLTGLREKAREIFLDTRAKVRNELTAPQQRKLMELIPQRRPEPAEAKPETMMGDPMKTPGAVPPAADKPASPGPDSKLAVGQPAPRFNLRRLDNRQPATLMSFGGKPLVLVFGSFTSPTFRDKVPVFEAMKKAYKGKANIVFVYTREAYPADEWDVQRNIDEQIAIKQPATIEERVKLAKDTRDGLKITGEMLVDDVDDGVASAYECLPNGAVVIDGNGRLVGKQKWADPHGLAALVDDALKMK